MWTFDKNGGGGILHKSNTFCDENVKKKVKSINFSHLIYLIQLEFAIFTLPEYSKFFQTFSHYLFLSMFSRWQRNPSKERTRYFFTRDMCHVRILCLLEFVRCSCELSCTLEPNSFQGSTSTTENELNSTVTYLNQAFF